MTLPVKGKPEPPSTRKNKLREIFPYQNLQEAVFEILEGSSIGNQEATIRQAMKRGLGHTFWGGRPVGLKEVEEYSSGEAKAEEPTKALKGINKGPPVRK